MINFNLEMSHLTSALFAPRIEVTPKEALFDEKVVIRVSGLNPGRLATVRARVKDDLDNLWESRASFKADAKGVIDLSSASALTGSYIGVDPMGLFWSMAPDPEQKQIASFMVSGVSRDLAKAVLKPMITALTAEVDGKAVATVDLERSFIARNIVRTPVRESGLVGVFFHPADSDPQPGILVLSGSGGGASEHHAALLASHGYAAFALAYFAMEGLPADLANIPIEYFGKGIEWMQAQDSVIEDKIGVIGWSRGGELSLVLGSIFSELKTVVAFVPSSVTWSGVTRTRGVHPSWTYHGKPLPFIASERVGSDQVDFEVRGRASMPIRITPYFLKSMKNVGAVEKATIPVEKTKGPILLISGQDDQMWPSSLFAKLIMERLVAHNHPYPYEHLSYEGAGHGIVPGYLPKTITIMRHPVTGYVYELGGNSKDNAFASTDAWSKTMRFVGQHLKRQ
jgi:dienelactone hydrolase